MNTKTDSKRSASPPSPLAGRTVDELASSGILSCAADSPLREVAWLMATNRVHAVVVIDEESVEVPVIADTDLIAPAQTGDFDQLCARDIAGTEAVTVRGGETLERAAQLLAEHHVTHLVVDDQRGVPVGILSTLDLARAIAEEP